MDLKSKSVIQDWVEGKEGAKREALLVQFPVYLVSSSEIITEQRLRKAASHAFLSGESKSSLFPKALVENINIFNSLNNWNVSRSIFYWSVS